MTAPRLAIFTICSNNYLPFARVLLDSARRHHPEAALFLCLADRMVAVPGTYGDDWTVIEGAGLAVPDFPAFAFRYDIMEFNTALKPFMFLHLTGVLGFDAAVYLDPDIEIFAPLVPVLAALAGGASFVFTPHLCAPNEDRQEPNDLSILRAGAYNLGFLGVGRGAEAAGVLAWWARRLRFQCVNAQADGLFVDQKFMDLVPGFAPGAAICHDTALNVAYWNLAQRRLDRDDVACAQPSRSSGSSESAIQTCGESALGHRAPGRDGDGWTVDGAPLVFFHFSGFDPRNPDRLSRHDGRFVGDLPAPLRALTGQYAGRLLAAGHGGAAAPYAYGRFRSGVPIPPVVRRMFREGPGWAGDPFDGYQAFLDAPVMAPTPPGQIVTNLLRFLDGTLPPFHPLPGLPPATRRDLHDPAHVDALLRWFVTHAGPELGLDPALVEPAAERLARLRPPAMAPARAADGEMDVAVTAPLTPGRADGGAGPAAALGRAMFHALLDAGIAAEMLDGTILRAESQAPVQMLCLDPALVATPSRWAAQGPADALRILVLASDTAQVPQAALDAVHEVWTPSRAMQVALAGHTSRPVIHMPAMHTQVAGASSDAWTARLRVLGVPS